MSKDYRYRVTKQDFDSIVGEISNMLGEQLYLIPNVHYMYLTSCTNPCAYPFSYYLQLSMSYSNANYEKLRAFEKGVMAVLNRR